MPQSLPTISVAVGAYNGAAHIQEQLDSIAAQTYLPVEVIVCDDGSTDFTPEIVEAFAQSSPFSVRLVRNETNLGTARNFGKAIELCDADIIALADQDDLWKPEKLATIAAAFESDPQLSLVFTNAEVVDRDLKPTGKTLSDTGRIDQSVRKALTGPGAFAFLLRRNVATGATMAFRKSLKELVLPIPEGLLTYHDAWIVQLVAAVSPIAFLPEPLMCYRHHPGQQTWDFVHVHGARRTLDKDYYAAQLRQLKLMRERLV